jgi:hypothetical protein
MKAIYKKRLLKCADIVDSVPRKEFEINRYFHECRTPACVLGHYTAATGFRHFGRPDQNYPETFPGNVTYETIGIHFGIDIAEAIRVFGSNGCNNAKTGKQAAKYIRQFVKRKEMEKL